MKLHVACKMSFFGILSLFLSSKTLIAQVSSNTPVCEGSAINFTVNVNGTKYIWTGPNSYTSTTRNPTIPVSTLSNAGFYTVGVIVGIDTTYYSTEVIVVARPPKPQVSSFYTACSGKSFTLYTNNYDPNFNYTWTGPSFNSTKDSLYIGNVTGANGGTYTVTASNGNCVSSSSSFTLTVRSKPQTPIISTAATYCENDKISLTTSNNTGYQLYWVGPNDFLSTNPNPVINPAVAIHAGQYSVVFIDPSGNCVGDTGRKVISMTPAPPRPSISGDTALCVGDTLKLIGVTPGLATIYSWNGPGGSKTTAQYVINGVNAGHAGIYTFNYSDTKCKSLDTSIEITIKPNPGTPSITPISSTNLCELDTLILTTGYDPSFSYLWTGPNNYTHNTNDMDRKGVTQADSGTYRLQVRNNGCGSGVATIKINIRKTPKVPPLSTNAPVCARTPLELRTDTQEVNVSYTWLSPTGNLVTDSVLKYPSSNYQDSGYYYVTASANGCLSLKDSVFVRIKHRIEPYGPYVSTPICEHYFFQLEQGVYEDAIYRWTGPHGFITSQRFYNQDSIQLTDAGIYIADIRNTCDTLQATFNVVVVPSPKLEIVGPNTICFYEDKLLETVANQPLTYIWNNGATTDHLRINEPGTYSLTGTNFANCTTDTKYTVGLQCEPTVFIPNAFSPDGKGNNEVFKIEANNVTNFHFQVFARDGKLVYESTDPDQAWGGTYKGVLLPPGLYVYIVKYTSNYNYRFYDEEKSGHIYLIR